MSDLADFIREGIEHEGHRNVFAHMLNTRWPLTDTSDRREQQRLITRFACENGWRVTFSQDGRCASFRPN